MIEITSKEDKDIAIESKKLLRKELRKELLNLFKTFNQELSQMESDPKKLEEDKAFIN